MNSRVVRICGWIFIIVLVILLIVLCCCACKKDSFTQDKFSSKNKEDCNLMVLSPSKTTGPRLPPTNQYIVFQIDCGGLNNIRMQFETLTVLAWLSQRTIVLPPRSTWYLMGNTQIEPSDVFDLDCWASHVPLLQYNEWIGIIGNKSGKRLDTEVNYRTFIGNIEKGTYGKVHEPLWSPGKTKFKMSNLKANNDPIWYFYCDKQEHFRNLDHRMLGNTECYFQSLGEDKKREMRKLIWESIKYKEEFYENAVKIMEQLGLKVGEYNAVHVRNWEGSRPQYKTRSQEEIIDRILKLDINTPILLLSQDVLKNVPERIKAKMDKLFNEYKLVRPPQDNEQFEQSVLEMLLAVPAKTFLGSPSSTYSTGIMQLRGYFRRFCDKIEDKPDFIDGKTSDYLKCSPPGKAAWDFDKISLHKTKDFYRNV